MKISDKQILYLFLVLKDSLNIVGGFCIDQKRRLDLLNEIMKQQDEEVKEFVEE